LSAENAIHIGTSANIIDTLDIEALHTTEEWINYNRKQRQVPLLKSLSAAWNSSLTYLSSIFLHVMTQQSSANQPSRYKGNAGVCVCFVSNWNKLSHI